MNDYLYSLIIELDTQERLFITNTLKFNKEDSILIFFFNYLCELKKFDEQTIKSSIKNKTIQKFYAQYKWKLYDAILRIMRQYNKSESTEKDLYDMLKDITFLFEKGRLNEVYTLALKGQSIAEKHEIFDLEMVFIKWLLMMAPRVSRAFDKNGDYELLKKITAKSLDDNQNLFSYRLKHLIYLHEKHENLIDLPPKQRSVASRKLLAELDLNEKDTQSAELKYGYHLIQYQIYLLESNLEKAKYHLYKAMDVLENKHHKEDRDYYNYIIGIINLIEIAFFSREVQVMDKLLDKLIEIEDTFGRKTLPRPYIKSYRPMFQLHYRTLDNKPGREKIALELVDQIENYNTPSSIKSEICLTLATYHWLKKDHAKALDFILQFKDYQNESVHFYAYRFLELIIYYELGEYYLLDSKTRSIYRYLSKRDQYNKVEKAILTAIKKGIRSKTKDETKEVLRELVNFLKTSKPTANVISLRYIYFEEWFESILEGVSVSELLASKQKSASSSGYIKTNLG
jgi:hypothetical protein